jgi:hypothetical protein
MIATAAALNSRADVIKNQRVVHEMAPRQSERSRCRLQLD